jgi:hypothetical protein
MAALLTTNSSAAGPTGFRRVWRVLRQLFHEIVGAIFALLFLEWIGSALRFWSRDVAHWLIALIAGVAVLFLFFSVSSFRRARKL